MSLDKSITHGKEKRKPYRGAKSVDATCRNHGGCPWCEKNRLHKFRDKHPVDACFTEETERESKGEQYDYNYSPCRAKGGVTE